MTMELFDSIPLSCLLNKKFLCVHGGISPDLKSVNQRLDSWKILKKLIDLEKSQKQDYSVTWYGLTLSIARLEHVIAWSKPTKSEVVLTFLGAK